MIAVDTSVLVALITGESGAEVYERLILQNDAITGAPTMFEWSLVSMRRRVSLDELSAFLDVSGIEIVPFGHAEFLAAADAFSRFGRGRHRARLNFGDCLSYAIAKVRNVPLLYVGDDFTHTDITPAHPT